MAERQRSFFDQDTKTRPSWQPNWLRGNGPSVPKLPDRQAVNMPPIAASSQSVAKLKAFQYHQEEESSQKSRVSEEQQDAEKENVNNAAHQTTPAQMYPPPQPLSQKSSERDTRDCPQTPIGRLPLSELLASGDECCQNLTFTPMERVLWENSPLSSPPNNSMPPKKKRKRAHSISSASSSQNEVFAHFASSKQLKDPQALQQALKTPKVDPANDLWSRYLLPTRENQQSPSAPGSLPFPPLIHSSSPQTPAPHRHRDGSLRRALSCIEWPTSVAKRRKMHHTNSQRASAAFATLDEPAEKTKISRVSLLVEKMHSGLLKSRKIEGCSSSEPAKSSPVAPRSDSPGDDSSFPYDKHCVEDVANVLSQAAMEDEDPAPSKDAIPDNKEPAYCEATDASTDFGDEDLDYNMLEATNTDSEQTLTNAGIVPSGEDVGRPKNHEGDENEMDTVSDSPLRRDSNPESILGISKLESQTALTPIRQHGENDKDEFDGDDGDIFAADLEDVFAKYDTQPEQPKDIIDKHGRPHPTDEEDVAKNKEQFSADTSRVKSENVVEVLSDEEDFGDESEFEQMCADATQIKYSGSLSQSFHDRESKILQRYIIKSVAESQYDVGGGARQTEKVLAVQSEKTKLSKAVVLRQAWLDSPCTPGSHVHIVGEFDRFGQCVIDNSHNLLILHPDHLISSTVVGDSFTCIRKAVLQDRVKATSDANQATLYGHLLHEIFQEALRANRWDDDFMSALIDTVTTRHLETLFEINVDHTTAVEQLKARAADLQAWAAIFVSAKPKPEAIVRDRNGAQAIMSINKLLEVEEHIWSPFYGLKGNIDATVQVRLEEENGSKTLTVPFELKTGKHSSAAHKAQTSLYSLLLSDRYDVDIACGILYYMQTSEISSIRTIRHELVPMIIQRNELANLVRNRTTLPPMLRKPYTCGKCYAQTPCFIYHKLVDDGNGETSGMAEKFDDLVKHLKVEHQQFFSKWDNLLTKEESDVVKLRRELWTMQSAEREKVGRCFGSLILRPGSSYEEEAGAKINRFHYTFIKHSPKAGHSFRESQIVVGEPIVVSDEKGHFALANGYVHAVRKHEVEVAVDRRLHNARTKKKNFDAETNQVFSGIMEIVEADGSNSTLIPTIPEEPVFYRLDKDEFSNGMAMVRNNLIQLMEKDVFGVQALRKLIVEGVAPTFNPTASQYTLGDTASQASLNVDQRAAIQKVMSAKDYALVLGMPGTGKTTTIAHIIRALVAQGKSVLLTSYTHTAVDNILLKLRNDKIGIFRLGAIAKVHPEVQAFADLAGNPLKTVEEIKQCYTRKVVATTCLGINHPIFNQRVFDYCIVDEASQITLPVCLGPIRMARTFILVGDHHQLPPLVQNKEALEGGLDVSLFKMLSDKHSSSVVNLEHQYRMCEDIMTLSNTLIYDGRLKCGTHSVATRSMTVSDMTALRHHHHNTQSILTTDPKKVCLSPSRGTCWIRDLLDPTSKVCFVNTDTLLSKSREVLENGSRITNPCEVILTTQLVESLLTVGIAPSDIGVITLYRSQLALLRQALRHRSSIEMHTADKFQGRDKEVVILSLVRSNEQQIVGDLLKDWRRVNVALTRARTKLIIMGSKSTLVGNELLKDLVQLMEDKKWWYDLPQDACEVHVFEEAESQWSGKGSSESRAEAEKSPGKNDKTILGMLGKGKENRGVKKMPAKQAKLDINALIRRRPVLRDIVNEAS